MIFPKDFFPLKIPRSQLQGSPEYQPPASQTSYWLCIDGRESLDEGALLLSQDISNLQMVAVILGSCRNCISVLSAHPCGLRSSISVLTLWNSVSIQYMFKYKTLTTCNPNIFQGPCVPHLSQCHRRRNTVLQLKVIKVIPIFIYFSQRTSLLSVTTLT